jgi:diacylglycerol kinase (ATP)
LFFVVNEYAGNGKGRRVFHRIERALRTSDRVAVTKRPGDARRIAADASGNGHDVVVAVGGDGTINDVLNGLADCDFKAALGIVPAGGGNDFAYALGLPAEPRAAVRMLRAGHTRSVDVGLVTFQNSGARRYYANMLGMGLSGEIAAVTRTEKLLSGQVSYLAQLLKRLFSAGPSRFQIDTEGALVVDGAIIAHLANGRREGRVFPVAPLASLDDGLLDLISVRDVRMLSRPGYIVQVLRGRLLQQPGVSCMQVPCATVRAIDALPCHVDGEPFVLEAGHEMLVEAQPRALRVIGP